MELTILGSGESCPNPGGACSGYLVRDHATALLVDCGSGVVGNLRKHVSLVDLDAIVITHMHADHFLDLVPLRYYLKYGPSARRSAPLPVFLPPGGIEVLTRLAQPISEDADFFSGHLALLEYQPRDKMSLGSLRLTFARMNHPVPTFAVRLQSEDRSIVFSSDTGPTPELARLALDAGILVCEAGFLEEQQGKAVHLTPDQAGAIAQTARAKTLVLTHMWSEFPKEKVLARTASQYEGPISIARENCTLLCP